MISSAGKAPKILFVNPRFPRSLWGFQGIHDIVGSSAARRRLARDAADLLALYVAGEVSPKVH